MDPKTRQRLIENHLEAIRDLEAQAPGEPEKPGWPPDGFYLLWHIVIGIVLGALGAIVSLLANVLGAPLFGHRALELIRVYLTFPMGERALESAEGTAVFIGCVLYLFTGAVFGILFHLALSLYFSDASKGKRFVVATVMGLVLWVFNFYLVLSWLQPLLLGGNWIVRLIPPWVGALTHLAFAWTMLLGASWGRFEPYRGTQKGDAPTRGTAAVALLLAVAASGCGGADPGASLRESTVRPDATEDPVAYAKWSTTPAGEHPDYNLRANLLQRGHLVYREYCIGCHGEYGDGNGPASPRLITRPRDFTRGIYKFRSTDSGSLPLEEDLYRTISRGLARVSMPAFPLMPENEKIAVIEYIKSFYPRWEEEKDERRVIAIPRAPEDLDSEVRILRGRMVYLQTGCSSCHGIDGRGTGATRSEYTDAWGYPQKAFDFTRGSLKGGNAPEDVYRTFHTGLRSIMPSFGGDTLAPLNAETFSGLASNLEPDEVERLGAILDQYPATAGEVLDGMSDSERSRLAERNSWDLVAYILSLRTQTTTAAAVLGPNRSGG